MKVKRETESRNWLNRTKPTEGGGGFGFGVVWFCLLGVQLRAHRRTKTIDELMNRRRSRSQKEKIRTTKCPRKKGQEHLRERTKSNIKERRRRDLRQKNSPQEGKSLGHHGMRG